MYINLLCMYIQVIVANNYTYNTWCEYYMNMKKRKEKKNKRPYIVPAWIWARYPNAYHDKSLWNMRGYASFRRWALLVESWHFISILRGCDDGLFVVKFPFVEYEIC